MVGGSWARSKLKRTAFGLFDDSHGYEEKDIKNGGDIGNPIRKLFKQAKQRMAQGLPPAPDLLRGSVLVVRSRLCPLFWGGLGGTRRVARTTG